jgi:hypothetical protein
VQLPTGRDHVLAPVQEADELAVMVLMLMVTDASPCSWTSAAVVSRVASWTARRCSSIVSVHGFGTSLGRRAARARVTAAFTAAR